MSCLLILSLLIGATPSPRIVAKVATLPKQDRMMVYSIMAIESAFNPMAKSQAGARGLMQITPIAVKEVKRRNPRCVASGIVDYHSVEQNIEIGYCYYKLMKLDYLQNKALALAAYNGGPSRANILRSLKPLNNETANYIAKVLYIEGVLKETCDVPTKP